MNKQRLLELAGVTESEDFYEAAHALDAIYEIAFSGAPAKTRLEKIQSVLEQWVEAGR